MSDQWFGDYEILEQIGQGAMATVYHARRRDFASAVALKVFSSEFATSDAFLRRFQTHAQMISGLRHEALVPVFDFGIIDEQPYLSMQYMPGGSLAAILQDGRLAPSDVMRVVRRIASALTYLHDQGVTHQHLSPSDILFDERGDAYLSDIGLTHLLSDQDAAITRAGGVIGSPAYMSPEQISDVSGGPSVDIYALGITTFEMLYGELPFTGDSPVRILMAHVTQPVPRVTDFAANLPASLQPVFDRVLAKQPADRYSGLNQFAGDLQAALFETDQDDYRSEQTASPTSEEDRIVYRSGDDLPDRLKDAKVDASDNEYPPPASPPSRQETDQRRPPRLTPEEREGRPTTPLSSPRGRGDRSLDESPPAPSDAPQPGTQGKTRGGFLENVFGGWSGTFQRASRTDDQPDSGQAAAPDPQPSPAPSAPQEPREQVRFTAFHPREAAAETWYTFLTYIHLPDLIDQVVDDAQKFADEMGGTPRAVRLRKMVGLERGTELLIVPEAPGLTFKPRTLSLTWDEDIERANFRFVAAAELIDQPAIGEISIFAGPVEIGSIPFAIPVVEQIGGDEFTVSAAADMYNRIFVSYSHQNDEIVKATIKVLQKLGLEVYADYISLRSGDDWDQRLLEMIDDSDVFQLFWSSQAAESPAVRREWTHALGLNKQPEGARPGVGYIRPVYWESPMPDIPPELAHIHFKHIPELIVVAEHLASA